MSTNNVRTGTEIQKRARGRPRGFDPAQALERARRVFLAKGFSATSLDDLARATGLNRPSLYAAFGDKESLYVHALRRYAGGLLVAMEGALAQRRPVAARMKRVFEGAIRIYTAPPLSPGCMIVGTANAESPARPQIAAASAELVAGYERAFERCFAHAARRGLLVRKPSPKARARMAMALLHTLAVRARIGVQARELRSVAGSVLPMICAGESPEFARDKDWRYPITSGFKPK